MEIRIPWTLILIFISLSLFYYFNQKARIKREDRRQKRNERAEKYLDLLVKSNSNKETENKTETK